MEKEGKLQRAHIQRSNLKDLEHGIRELEKRGYKLITQGLDEFECKTFRHVNHSVNHTWYDGMDHVKKYKAVMERVYYG